MKQVVILLFFVLTSCSKVVLVREIVIETISVQCNSPEIAIASGEIIDYGEGVKYYGHCWSTEPIPTVNDFKTEFTNPLRTGNFTSTLTSLSPGVTYFVRSYASDGNNIYYGKDLPLETDYADPTVTTLKTEVYGVNTAMLVGLVDNNLGNNIIKQGFYWGTLPNSDLLDKVQNTEGNFDTLKVFLDNLSANNTYYYRAFVQTSTGVFFGEMMSFTTDLKDIAMIFVKGGSFQMGSSNGKVDEQPIHQVTLSDFRISRFEITNIQFCEFLNTTEIDMSGWYNQKLYIDTWDEDCQIYKQGGVFYVLDGYADYPAIEVTWHGANAYCEWAGGRLPSEAEWEFAARGGIYTQNTLYSGSIELNDVAWYASNSLGKSHKIGLKASNELGLFDMAGNVSEWCSDWYGSDYYSIAPEQNPIGAITGTKKSIRGGNWNSSIDECTNTARYNEIIDWCNAYTGFRFVKD